MQVNIYTWSQVKNLKIAPAQELAAGFVLEAITSRGPATRTETYLIRDMAEETNKNQAELMILIKAMGHMKAKTEIDIWTENKYIAGQFSSGNVSRWEENDWKNSKGETVKHAELYERLLDLLEGNTVIWHVGQEHEYRRWLKKEVEERRNYLHETEGI